MSTNQSEQVKHIVKAWAKAISRGDRSAILSHHADDVLMYDFPDEVRGLDSYNGTWDFFFENKRGPITFQPSNMEATAGERVAFVTCNMHCEGTSAGPLDFRLTVGLEKRDGEWLITHEHHSLRTNDSRFIDNAARA